MIKEQGKNPERARERGEMRERAWRRGGKREGPESGEAKGHDSGRIGFSFCPGLSHHAVAVLGTGIVREAEAARGRMKASRACAGQA